MYICIFFNSLDLTIAFFSGSFDPPHIGHLAVANYIYKEKLAGEVWLSPTPHNPCKNACEQSLPQARMDMAAIAVAPYPHIRLCDIEHRLPQPSYTVNTLRALRERYPEHTFILVIGADNWLIFNRWRDYQHIIEEFQILIYPREGMSIDIPADYTQVRAIAAPEINISSTGLRNSIRRDKDVRHRLPPGVYEYVQQHGLYFEDKLRVES